MNKQVSKAFGKQVFLLGEDADGFYYWLGEPTWDCGWCWGFGYIETYTVNKNPARSKDINSHQHAVDFLSEWWRSWNGSKPILTTTTFDEEEGWELSELFKQFYFLKQAAEFFKEGKADIANANINTWKDFAKTKEINEVIIPQVTKRILEILTPEI